MKYCILISDCDTFLEETKCFIQSYTYYKTVEIKLRKDSFGDSRNLLSYISSKVDEIHQSDLRESVILINDIFNIQRSNAVSIPCDSDNFYGILILAFPELEFVFLNEIGSNGLISWLKNEKALKHFSFSPLFDYSGIRATLKNNTNAGLNSRNERARIVEDEQSFSYFHGYIAYKRGFLSKLYTSISHLDQDRENNATVQLQIQDLNLGFVDKRQDNHISDLWQRYTAYPFLKNTVHFQNSFVVSVGRNVSHNSEAKIKLCVDCKYREVVGRSSGNSIVLRSNHAEKRGEYIYINDNPDDSGIACGSCGLKIGHNVSLNSTPVARLIYKPTKGIFHIVSKDMLDLEVWPSSCDSIDFKDDFGGHSAEGIFGLIAETLIFRAQAILDNTKQVSDAIHAATLAMEAKELLNGLSPTLALQAYILQQEAEVTAECLFAGTEYNIELEARFKEIESEVTFITKRFSSKLQRRTCLNAQLSIIQSLSGIYNTYKQFEEELMCLNKARKYSYEISILLASNNKFKKYTKNTVFWLLDSSLSSIWIFFRTILLIQLVYGFVYFIFAKWSANSLHISSDWDLWISDIEFYFTSLLSASKYFFTTETSEIFSKPFKDHPNLSSIILGSQGFLSISSVSVLMAMVVLRISRK